MPVNTKITNIEYLPYGELFFERRDYWNTPYKFNAKELDAETGMYYYGARYYTPEVSIWLSVDPLSDKYPHQSNYMYCSGRPVNVIDPDGMDEYEFTAAGYIKNVKTTDFDSFHKVTIDKNGKTTRIEGGALILDKKVVTGQTVLTGDDGESVNYLKVTGDAEATQIFEHLANNSTEYGTEYGLTRIGGNLGDDGKNMIGVNTTHTNGSTSANRVVYENKYSIREAIHNHPSGNNTVSEGDIDVAKMIQNDFPQAKFFNYTKTNGYTSYNKNTPYPIHKAPILPELIVKP